MAWGLAHTGMEALMGLGILKVGTLLTLLWALAFVPAVRGSVPARYAAVALGALASFYLALVHFVRLNMPLAWLGPLPILTRGEVVGPGWVVPYNVLVYAGIFIGVANLWAGARVLRTGRAAHGNLLAMLVGLLLTVLELYRISRPDGPKGSGALLGAFGIGLFALTVMVLARACHVAAEPGETDRYPDMLPLLAHWYQHLCCRVAKAQAGASRRRSINRRKH
jgi:hypothetical protein